MNDEQIANLYRRMTAGDAAGLDVARVLAATEAGTRAERAATATRLAASSTEAALVRMLRALHADSERLAAGLARGSGETARPAHVRRGAAAAYPVALPATRRRARARRIGRWSALAACLVAVLGVWSWQHTADIRGAAMDRQANQEFTVSDPQETSADRLASRGDLIFTSRDDIFHAPMDPLDRHAGGGDQLFRAGFNGS